MYQISTVLVLIKGRTIRKFMGRGGGGWAAKYKQNIRAREKKNAKNSCTPINPKKHSCYGRLVLPPFPKKKF